MSKNTPKGWRREELDVVIDHRMVHPNFMKPTEDAYIETIVPLLPNRSPEQIKHKMIALQEQYKKIHRIIQSTEAGTTTGPPLAKVPGYLEFHRYCHWNSVAQRQVDTMRLQEADEKIYEPEVKGKTPFWTVGELDVIFDNILMDQPNYLRPDQNPNFIENLVRLLPARNFMQVRAKLCRLHNEYKTICMQLTEAGKADGPPLATGISKFYRYDDWHPVMGPYVKIEGVPQSTPRRRPVPENRHEETLGLQCRLCLQATSSEGFQLSTDVVLEDHSLTLTLQQIMEQICMVEFNSMDAERLPNHVCETCTDGLISAYRLRLTAKKSDFVLLGRLKLARQAEDSGNDKQGDVPELLGEDPDGTESAPSARDPNLHECQLCRETFQERDAFETHLSSCPKISIKCTHCQSEYYQMYTLIHHTKTNHKYLSSHKCHFCGVVFSTNAALADHIATHTGVVPYVCQVCKKSFRHYPTFKEHRRTHSDANSFLCSECGKTFYTRSSFWEHVTRHSGNRRFACEHCPTKFFTRRSWMQHQSKHTGERPYTCNICDKKFSSKNTLKAHERRHRGEKPHACRYCEKTFLDSGRLTRHVRTHTGEKPHKCNHCVRAFAQRCELFKHLRSHGYEYAYQCDQCPEQFEMHRELKSHIEEHFKQTKKVLQDHQYL